MIIYNLIKNSRRYLSSSASKSINDYLLIKDFNLNGLVRRIDLINDKQRNTLSLDLINYLQETILKTINTNNYRIIILSAKNVFSSGHNLKELTTEKGNDYHSKVFNEMSSLCLLLQRSSLPIIAEINGLCAAAGLQLALSCDLIVASTKASFSTPGVKFGIFCSTPGVALARNLSPKLSLKMLLTGESINAHDAYKYGLISELVDDEIKLQDKTNELCMKINSNSKYVVELGKKCFYEQINESNLSCAYDIASKQMTDNLKLKDTQNGLKAFSLKQKPIWSNKSDLIE